MEESLDEETNYEIVLVTSDPNGDVGFYFDTRFGLIHAHFKRSFRQGMPGYRIDKDGLDMEYCLANFERRTGFEGIDFGECKKNPQEISYPNYCFSWGSHVVGHF